MSHPPIHFIARPISGYPPPRAVCAPYCAPLSPTTTSAAMQLNSCDVTTHTHTPPCSPLPLLLAAAALLLIVGPLPSVAPGEPAPRARARVC